MSSGSGWKCKDFFQRCPSGALILAFVVSGGSWGRKFWRFSICLGVSILQNGHRRRRREKGQEKRAFRLKMPRFIVIFIVGDSQSPRVMIANSACGVGNFRVRRLVFAPAAFSFPAFCVSIFLMRNKKLSRYFPGFSCFFVQKPLRWRPAPPHPFPLFLTMFNFTFAQMWKYICNFTAEIHINTVSNNH